MPPRHERGCNRFTVCVGIDSKHLKQIIKNRQAVRVWFHRALHIHVVCYTCLLRSENRGSVCVCVCFILLHYCHKLKRKRNYILVRMHSTVHSLPQTAAAAQNARHHAENLLPISFISSAGAKLVESRERSDKEFVLLQEGYCSPLKILLDVAWNIMSESMLQHSQVLCYC